MEHLEEMPRTSDTEWGHAAQEAGSSHEVLIPFRSPRCGEE